jgi:hypothetical protein
MFLIGAHLPFSLPPSSLYRAAASPDLHHGFKLGEFITTSVQEAAAPVDPVPRLQMEECDRTDLKWASEEHRLVGLSDVYEIIRGC